MDPIQAIQRLRQVIRRQHKALSTESCYVHWLTRYIRAVRQMPETLSSHQKLERFLIQLARCRDIASSTQNLALNAILYFYKEVLDQPVLRVDALRAKRPAQMRHAPTISETQALLHTIQDEAGYPTNLIARMLYGCGLRVAASQMMTCVR